MQHVTPRPHVVAHRGASIDEAEHTLAAYARALDDGADGLECDVRLTRDGVLVCVHDRRIDRTSSGRGVVSTLEIADLADLDFGSWHQRSASTAAVAADEEEDTEEPEWDRTGVLTLDRLLEMVADSGREVEVAIETKHPTRYAGLVELTLVEVLARHGLTSPRADASVRARVMSFAGASLRRLRSLAPGVPTVYLMERVPIRFRDGSLPAGAAAAGPSLRLLRAFPDYVDRVHAMGSQVHVWTVDRPEDVEFVADLGVDVIITNRPGATLRQLRGEGRPESTGLPVH
jgi:glycerophosphoryl diester phosphodiesterase